MDGRIQGGAARPYADFDVLTFNRQDLLQTATLDTRGYQAVDAISNKEMKQNKGKFAIIKLFDGKAMRMKKTAGNRLCAKFYIDGNLAGNEKDIHGIESFMGITPGAQVATDDEATVYNDTYAGLSTTKGAYGGAQGERHFDFWTPTVVNCNKTGTSWATDADAFLRYAIVKHTRGQKADERLDLIQLTRSAYVSSARSSRARSASSSTRRTSGSASSGSSRPSTSTAST